MEGQHDSGDSSDLQTVELTVSEIQDVLEDKRVEVHPFVFFNDVSYRPYDNAVSAHSSVWKALRDGERTEITWVKDGVRVVLDGLPKPQQDEIDEVVEEQQEEVMDINQNNADCEMQTIELVEEDIQYILNGHTIEAGGYTFVSYEFGVQINVDCMGSHSGWKELLDGERDFMFWSGPQVRVTLADQDQDSSTMSFDTETRDYVGGDMATISDKDRTHVTMEVTMDIRDMDGDSKEAICKLARLYEDSFVELIEKSRDYGWSFLTSGKKLSQSKGTPFDSPTRSQTFGLLTRTGDKRERLIENVFGDGSSTVSDEPHVTAQEAGNYYFMLAFVLANPDLADAASDV